MSDEKTKQAYEQNSSYSFEGTPEAIDVQEEIDSSTSGLEYDAYKLTEVLMAIGQKMIGVPLYDYQIEPCFRIIYSMLARDGAEVTMLFARQSGKSEVVTFCSVTLGVLLPVLAKIYPKQLGHFKTGVKMGLLAPQGEQVQTVYSRCMERLLSEPVRMFLEDPDILDAPLSNVYFKLKSGTFMTGQSAAKQSKIESKTYHIAFLDEAQDMDTEKVRRSIMPMLASTFGTAVRTGTPSRKKGDFYHTIQANKKEDKKLIGKRATRSKKLHFEYDYLAVIRDKEKMYKQDGRDFHLLYKKSVMRDKKAMGEKSDFFRLAYKIEWLLDIGMFINEEALEELVYDGRRSMTAPEKKVDFVVAGLDIASARNATVLSSATVDFPAAEFGERPQKTMFDWLCLRTTNYEEQFHILVETIMKNQTRILYADYTGVGRALTDMLIYHIGEYVDIVPYTFTPSSKSDMWKALDEDITNRRWTIPANTAVRKREEFKDFQEQMVNLQKYWRGSYMVAEKISGFEDDYCDSFGLVNLAGNHLYTPPTAMEVTENILIATGTKTTLAQRSRW